MIFKGISLKIDINHIREILMKKYIFIAVLLAVCLFFACSVIHESGIPQEFAKQSETELHLLFTAADGEGNLIKYYLCLTTYHSAAPKDTLGLHTDAITAVFDIENTPLIREFDISGHPAAIYQGESANYICCTSSPTASVVMEYDPDSLSEENAVKTIQSIF